MTSQLQRSPIDDVNADGLVTMEELPYPESLQLPFFLILVAVPMFSGVRNDGSASEKIKTFSAI